MSIVLFALSNDVWQLLAIIINAAVLIWLKLDQNQMAKEVREVHHATNSMKDELVAEVRRSEYAAGKKSETDKADKFP
jgi:hypothetical protein